MGRLTIGQLAKVTGIAPKTIRYYEEVGVVPPPERSRSRYRLYSETDVRRFELIRRASALDMTLPEVRQLVGWASSGTCDAFSHRFRDMVRRKREEVDLRISDLLGLKQDLQRLDAHLAAAEAEEAAPGRTVLECSPENCACLGPTAETWSAKTGVDVMAGSTGAQDIDETSRKQDCGCGCGGGACGSTWRELVWVEPNQVSMVREQAAGRGCQCGCCSSAAG